MEKYDKLLTTVSQKYSIAKGKTELIADWKVRIIYSICGMMAYASLWDDVEEDTISIVHLKRRVRDILSAYKEMYPEVSVSLPYISEELEEEISNIFLSTGMVYHCPNQIVPSIQREAFVDEVCFQRGILPDDIKCISGIGLYSVRNELNHIESVRRMFGLEEQNLLSIWKTTVLTASWKIETICDSSIEYLRLFPPFSRGYWTDKPDTTGRISMLRLGPKGSQLYYLYKCAGERMKVSQLPQWQVEGYNYRTLACACLSSYDSFPPIEYICDGDLVHIQLNYLLPPRELEFLKLYSWPETCTSLPCNFNRKSSLVVFRAVQRIFTETGYTFKEEGKADA